MPCAVGPTTSAATIVPVTGTPAAGQAGLPPPPQKNAMTPPETLDWPKWMWATPAGAPPGPEERNVEERGGPAAARAPTEKPRAWVEMGGVSSPPRRSAVNISVAHADDGLAARTNARPPIPSRRDVIFIVFLRSDAARAGEGQVPSDRSRERESGWVAR